MLHEFSTVSFLLQFLENFSQLLRKERSHCVHTATFSYIYPIRTQSRQGIVRYILTVQIQSQSFFFSKVHCTFFFKRSKSCKVHTYSMYVWYWMYNISTYIHCGAVEDPREETFIVTPPYILLGSLPSIALSSCWLQCTAVKTN